MNNNKIARAAVSGVADGGPTGAGRRVSGEPPSGLFGLGRNVILLAAILVAVAASLAVTYRFGIEFMLWKWGRAEYNHAYMIPAVAVYLLLLRAGDLARLPTGGGAWLGIVLVVVALAVGLLGDISTVVTLTQFALLLALWGLAVAAGGWRGIRILWVPLVYLAFMVPLPNFIETRATQSLMLWSSQLGVAVIRAMGDSVFLEGNVIDLGGYKLQVAEACSGMRYLYPLLSFGFLCAVLYRGKVWQKVFLVLATIPITILMNSFRIGVVGLLVNRYGTAQAEGFLHDFEGWVVFMASVGILLLIIAFFARREKQPFLTIFGLDIPEVPAIRALLERARPNRQVIAAVALLVVAAIGTAAAGRPDILIPNRKPLDTFPMKFGDWAGRRGYLDDVYQQALQTSDHLLADFSSPKHQNLPVGIWVAYYDAQAMGASVHSPQACLPGGGWRIDQLSKVEIPGVLPDGGALRVNRAVISRGEDRQLVYYWFAQRGRVVTDEFAAKWYILLDGLTKKRTDGALVRISTIVDGPRGLAEADERMAAFVRAADPRLAFHLPGSEATGEMRELPEFSMADITGEDF